jgi:hypothetical protein
MNTEPTVKSTGTVSSKTRLSPDLLGEIYVSLYANTLASKAGLRAGVAYIDGNKTDLVACDLLEVSRMLLKTAPDFQIDDANTLQQFSDFIQRKVLDFVPTKESVNSFGSNSLQKELTHCQEIVIQECRFIIGQTGDAGGEFFVLSEVAKEAVSTREPGAMRSLWSQLLAAKTFLLKAVELFSDVLQDTRNNGASARNASYQKFEAFAPLIWVSNSFYDIAPEEEINSPENLNVFLEAIRFQFPELNSESTYQDELCIELLEQCLSEARIAGVGVLQITLIAR